MSLTFKQFVTMVNEDVGQEIEKLTADIAMIDTQITQRTQPLIARKQQLQKMLAIKQKQSQAQGNQQQNPQQGNQQPVNNQTTTPGSSGAQTPGGSPRTF